MILFRGLYCYGHLAHLNIPLLTYSIRFLQLFREHFLPWLKYNCPSFTPPINWICPWWNKFCTGLLLYSSLKFLCNKTQVFYNTLKLKLVSMIERKKILCAKRLYGKIQVYKGWLLRNQDLIENRKHTS